MTSAGTIVFRPSVGKRSEVNAQDLRLHIRRRHGGCVRRARLCAFIVDVSSQQFNQERTTMGKSVIMRGRHLLTDARLKAAGLIADGAIAIVDGLVAAVGLFSEISARYPDLRVLGDGRQLLLPGLVDAHS